MPLITARWMFAQGERTTPPDPSRPKSSATSTTMSESLAVRSTSSQPAAAVSNADEFVLLGDQSKFANNVVYRLRPYTSNHVQASTSLQVLFCCCGSYCHCHSSCCCSCCWYRCDCYWVCNFCIAMRSVKVCKQFRYVMLKTVSCEMMENKEKLSTITRTCWLG